MKYDGMSGSDIDSIKPDNPANAYFLVFQDLYGEDAGLNNGKYLAVDMTNAKLDKKADFIKLMQEFCEKSGYALLEDSFEGLEEKGYIKDLNFIDGFLLSFNDKELDENKLITSGVKWFSGLGAVGADYTVEKNHGVWEITDTGGFWIS